MTNTPDSQDIPGPQPDSDPIQPKETVAHSAVVNISSHLKQMAHRQPFKRAVVFPAGRDKAGRISYTHLTFRQLEEESDCLAYGLEKIGITRGTRTVLMVKPCIDFFVLMFALFKTGAVPVVVDPGMGIGRMIRCLQESRPQAFVGIPKAHLLRYIYPKYFKTIETWVTAGGPRLWSGSSLDKLYVRPWRAFPAAKTGRDDTAAVLFTTGSTGPAKGAVYTHGNFDAQVRHIQAHFQIQPDEIDLPTFPLFALFDPALGMTAIIPDMDPTQPAWVDPEKIIEPIMNHGVTNMFASPALLNRVGQYGRQHSLRLPSLRRVISAGAPVTPANIEQFSRMLDSDSQIHTPYGATEAMPIISIASREILSETRKLSEQGFGICVGRALNQIEVQLIGISDDPIADWSPELVVTPGEIGEFAVRGDLVTIRYFERPRDDSLAKINDRDGIWHRMGDLGWQDNKGRFWYCGRKNHRVITAQGTLYTIPCEAIFNNHAAVERSALVGVGKAPEQIPVICIEPRRDEKPKSPQLLTRELLDLAQRQEMTKSIRTVLFSKTFPVDIRHNAKIFREKLALWAASRINGKRSRRHRDG